MSWLYSRALVEDYLQATCSESERYAPLNGTNSPEAFLSNGKMTELSTLSRYGMTCEPLTEPSGVGVWICYLEGFHAKRFLQRHVEETSQVKTCGLKCEELLKNAFRNLSLQKMCPSMRLTGRLWIFAPMVTSAPQRPIARKTWVQTIYGNDIGYLHTPTTIANFAAPSMQKHKSCQNFVHVFGKPTPMSFEYLMGWPIGWTSCGPLEMGKYHAWRQRHF